ncbi:50S ribosomal protein L3 [Babesia sp. Xinjiang]|uniref:50S ribosomal protein L3 n=1 Tax=Babesia sp. Xinjiang TaxID=462227 RepID=UPI000A2447C2|nr:50S ribosomal protein L3 [Babesia sp. Xinjiang]ORM41223.1 50S ribosomal protein L3 [Babesia sp. Xinjiang]
MVLPLAILRAGKSQPALIELKSGETYSGILSSCDVFMNVHMVNAICTSKKGDEFWKLSECFIRGNNVKSFRLPEEVATVALEESKAAGLFVELPKAIRLQRNLPLTTQEEGIEDQIEAGEEILTAATSNGNRMARGRVHRVRRQNLYKEDRLSDASEREVQSGASKGSDASPSGAVHEEADVTRVANTLTDEATSKIDAGIVNMEGNNGMSQIEQEKSTLPYDEGQQHMHSDEAAVRSDEERIAAFRIFVSKLSYEATREDLEEYFSQFGNITDVHIPRQPGNPALNKGYGFVSFEDESTLMRVLDTRSHVVLGREVMLDRATGQKYHTSSKVSEDGNARNRDKYPRYKRQYDGNESRLDRYYRRERDDRYRCDYYPVDRRTYANPVSYVRSYSGFDPHKPVSYVFTGASKPDHYGAMEYDNRYAPRTVIPVKTRTRTVPKLFIGRLDPDTTVTTLRNYFLRFGEIADAYIPPILVAALAHSHVLFSARSKNRTARRFTLIPDRYTEHRKPSPAYVASNPKELLNIRRSDKRFAGKEQIPSDFTLTPRDRVVIAKDPSEPRPYLWNVNWPETERKIELRAIKYHVGQIWSPDGHVETVTALQVLPCVICEFMDFGYALVAYGRPTWERRWNRRSELGKLLKNSANFACMKPVKLQPPQDYALGQILDVSAFAGCTHVKVTGVTKGKGFAGVIKRYGFARGPMSHGSKHHRKPGSIGASTTPGRVKPGKRMPGRMGGKRCTFRKLRVLGINPETSLMYVKALVAGARGSYVSVMSDMQTPRPDNILK